MMTSHKIFPLKKIQESGSDFVTPYGEIKFYKGKGRKSDRNIDTWEDKKQNTYLKALEKARKK